MVEVAMYGVLDVVSFKWLLASHHGMPVAQQIDLLLFTRSILIILSTWCFIFSVL